MVIDFRAGRVDRRFLAALVFALSMSLVACGGDRRDGGASTTTSLGSTQASSNSVTLAWDPPASTSISGYRVYFGTAPGAYAGGIDIGNVTSYTVLGLNSATRFYFAVTAVDSLGNESAYSNEAYKDIP